MAESTDGWFGVREKYYSLADKPWLISQIRSSEQVALTLERIGIREDKVMMIYMAFRLLQVFRLNPQVGVQG